MDCLFLRLIVYLHKKQAIVDMIIPTHLVCALFGIAIPMTFNFIRCYPARMHKDKTIGRVVVIVISTKIAIYLET
jgi:hypothetical protein